jgi:hypothetical protein
MKTILAKFQAEDGTIKGAPVALPTDVTPAQLEMVINEMLSNVIFS